MSFPAGKLPHDVLRAVLDTLEPDESVIVGPGIGRDAAAVRADDQVLVLKTDPVTFATDAIGWYLVNVNANDIACMGADPRWLLVTALLPEGRTDEQLVNGIFADVQRACAQVGCTLVGGHSEITEGLDRPILVGNMIGTAHEADLIDPKSAQPGDQVLLLAGVAIEGTSILATEMVDRLAGLVDDATLRRARGFLEEPGISVVRYARALRETLGDDLHALHDPTEGGLITALHELAEATGLGIEIEQDQIKVYPETEAISHALGIDPLGLIASGALLAVVPESRAEQALEAVARDGTPARVIGRMTADTSRRALIVDGHDIPLPIFDVDEIARIFAED
jgi:hydrogenase expression/formation protein HypE